MKKVKIYGAGAAGNHLAHACRSMNWDVLICDTDHNALKRMKEEVYPARYEAWDDNIKLSLAGDAPVNGFDIVVISTPPESHMTLAINALREERPQILLIEKPASDPSLENVQRLYEMAGKSDTTVCIGYNHTLCRNTKEAQIILGEGKIGDCVTINAGFQEHWEGILNAHPWLSGPEGSYLGFTRRGGGASLEHSHAINLWQHFAHFLDLGKIVEVNAFIDFVEDGSVAYDRICNFLVKTQKGVCGLIQQDLVTRPPRKYLTIQGDKGSLSWHANWGFGEDAVIFDGNGETRKKLIPQKRHDDFKCEVEHLLDIMEGKVDESPISLERGLDTMMVIAAAHQSHDKKRAMRVDYSNYSLSSIVPL